jgi:maleate isomerase
MSAAKAASSPAVKHFALGTITPSGNRVVEAVTMGIAAAVPGMSAQFTRIPVRGDTGGVTGYDWPRMIEAATLLADARPDAISWNGTKGGVLGFDTDRELCARITEATGIPASTAALAILDALRRLSARRIALVTPYDDAYQAKCVAAFAAKGIECVAERHSGLSDNFSYGEVPAEEILAMTRAALAEGDAQAVVYFCTNFPGATLAPVIEAESPVTVLDSTALGVWGAMRAVGYETQRVTGWGRVFDLV